MTSSIPNKYAIIVGVSKYDDSSFTNLSYATRDAQKLADVLAKRSGIDPERIYLLSNTSSSEFTENNRTPTKPNILDVLKHVVQSADEESEIFFFFAGHGVEIGHTPYLLTTDTKQSVMDLTALKVQDLNTILENSRSRFVVRIFDACRSTFFGGRDAMPVEMSPNMENAFFHDGSGWATLSSCSSGERSWESDEFEQGVFSYFLCEALDGKAADKNGHVTLYAMADYVKKEVQGWCDRNLKTQTPHFEINISGVPVISWIPIDLEESLPTSFRHTIFNLLHQLPIRRLDALKDLFWNQLNYDRVNTTLSIRNWPETLTVNLAQQPILFAKAGEGDGGFHIIYCCLKGALNLVIERPIVNKLLSEHPYGLFIFSDAERIKWHFVNVKFTTGRNIPTRRMFRRITVGPGELLRTATERLTLLDIETIKTDSFGVSPAFIQQRHDEAFDVEKVTREFFSIYHDIFDAAEAELPTILPAEIRRLYTQRFFNRLLFLAFLERKGWMDFNGRKDYLKALYDDYSLNDHEKRPDANFHRKRLNTLFFLGLNNPREKRELDKPAFKILRDLIGEVPYLNGGLFDKEIDDENWFFQDKTVKKILRDLIYRFNFTVMESTPLDVEVAVDPEMLGKIFEELVTGRHETGSYYTPKPVVSFMCREALKSYLQNKLKKESSEIITSFIDESNGEKLSDPIATLKALEDIKVCDPACGSGAYLLGMLHELLEARESVLRTKKLPAKTVYAYKNDIIQKNLYGVDKDHFAVNIARLRLWLSLIVDFEGETPPPLPNLKYKIEAGDSLTSPDPSGGLETGFRKQQIDSLLNAKDEYITAHDKRKKELEQEIETLKAGIRAWSGIELNNMDDAPEWLHDRFDWVIEFAELFVKKERGVGFDVVLANPPYVRADAQFKHIADETERQAQIAKWQYFRKQLKQARIYDTLHEKWDLYIPFLERAYQLLVPNGQMVFIIPDSYNAAKYTNKSHGFFLQNSQIMRIDFCSEINLFDAGVSNTILHFEKGEFPAVHQPFRARRWGKREDFEINTEILPTSNQNEFGDELFKSENTANQKSRKYVQLDNVFYVSYGLAVSSDEKKFKGEFVTEDVVSLVKDEHHPKLFVEGKDLTRWWIKRIRYLEWGTDRAPAKFRRQTFPELFDVSEKLISLVVASGGPPVVYDDKKCYTTHTSCIFVPWYLLKGVVNKSINKSAKYHHQDPFGDREQREETSRQFNLKYILAIMNSDVANQWLKSKVRSKNHKYPDDWKQLPVEPISLEEQQPFVEKVDAILGEYAHYGYPLPSEAGQKVKTLERELDEMVARLYDE